MKILLVYPGATWSPYDIACGYEDALSLTGHNVFSFPYHSYYALFHHLFTAWEKSGRDIGGDIKTQAAMWASRMVIPEAIEFVPDVVLVIMGVSFHIRAFRALFTLGLPVATVLTESPYCDVLQAGMASNSHTGLIFTNDKSSVESFDHILDAYGRSRIPVVYLPHSYNPEQHKPFDMDVDLYRQFASDIFFHGTMWKERAKLLEGLSEVSGLRKYDVQISGARFSPEHDKMVEGTLMDNRAMAIRYNCTKIALNHHRTEMYGDEAMPEWLDPYSLGPRAFEIAACGTFMLTDYRPEVTEVFGNTVAIYKDRDDLIAKAIYYLEHEDEREEMAAAAWQRVAQCSFLDRARGILIPAIQQHLLGGTNASITNHT